jgi:hypothetical protein
MLGFGISGVYPTSSFVRELVSQSITYEQFHLYSYV